MIRLALATACLLAVTTAGSAHAGELPRAIGMYMPNGTSLALVESKVEVTVRGPIVEAIVTQKFVNKSDKPTEATYVFPLPFDAAVSAMAIESGNRKIHATIEKREQAQQRYEQAVRAGVAGALLDQERPDVFTQTVAAVPAKGAVSVVLRFDTTARFQDGVWELVLPLVVAPRYVPGTATNRPTTGTGRAPDTDRAPDASRVTPGGSPGAGGPTTVVLKFAEKPTDLTCPTHEMKVHGTTGEATFTDAKTDHDAVVRWKAPASAAGWVEQDADGGYAAVVVEAPTAAPRVRVARWMLVLDRSAASRGDADAVARPLVRGLFSAMSANDRVAVIGSDTLPWGTGTDVARAIEQTWTSNPGPFDLTKVLDKARPDGSPLVLVSGGLVADDRAVIAAATRLGVPIHVIGVGPAPARALLMQIATASGGTARFALPGDDVAAMAKAALADVASPPLPLSVTWGTLVASEVVPGVLPRLGAGQATLVLARVKKAQTANGRARGELFAIEAINPRALDGSTTTMGPLARRWARNRLDEMIAGRVAPAVITSHALKYGLLSPYTSMVAVGSEVVVQGGVKRSVAIPVSVPAGMKWQMVKKETTVEKPTTDNHATEPDGKRPTVSKKTDKKTDDDKKPVATKTVDRDYTRNVPKPQRPEPKPAPTTKPTKPKKEPPRQAAKPPPPPPAPVQGNQPGPGSTAGSGVAEPDKAERPKKRPRRDYDDEDALKKKDSSGEDDGDGRDFAKQGAPQPAPRSISARADHYAETISVTGGGVGGRKWRLAASFAGGFARSGGDNVSLLSTGARLELAMSRRLLAGIDTSLWLLDGDKVTGQALASVAILGLERWLEVGFGVGLQFGQLGAGPATGISLRFHLPPKPRASLFLRYDGALIYDANVRRGQSSVTGGIEWGF